MEIVKINNLEFELDTIDLGYKGNDPEINIRCHTNNPEYLKRRNGFEEFEENIVDNFYFAITKNIETNRFKPSTCRIFYINNDGYSITIDNLKITDYQEIYEIIKEFSKWEC
jgi:hypothetical protein